MAYRFRHSETVADNVKRIAREEITSAIQFLRGKNGANGDDSIHEVRKTIKRIRALMRLVRQELGPTMFGRENRRLRDAGHKLSDLRDAAALVGSLDGLGTRQRPVPDIRRKLLEHKQHLVQETGTPKLRQTLISMLTATSRSIAHWKFPESGFQALEAGAEKTYRDGRKALAQARRTGSREDFHEWRKRVKDHWYQIRLLKKSWNGGMKNYERDVRKLEGKLGEDLNLGLLRDQVTALTISDGTAAPPLPLAGVIESNSKQLRDRALAIGDTIYAAKPRDFRRKLKHLWKSWK